MIAEHAAQPASPPPAAATGSGHTPRLAGDPHGSRAALLLVAAGAICGCGDLHPWLWWLAWLGVALTALGLRLPSSRAWLVIGLLAGSFAQQWAGHPWYHEVSSRMLLGFAPGAAVISLIAGTLLMVLPERLPMIVIVLILPSPKREGLREGDRMATVLPPLPAPPARGGEIPVFLWLPFAWWLGEWLNDRISGLSQGDWLYTQWQVDPVLRAVGHLGWVPALLLCLTIAAASGEALYARSVRLALLAVAGVASLLLLPPLPVGSPADFAGVAAVHMKNYFHPPRSAPPGTTLMIWPEVVRSGRPRMREGGGQGRIVQPPFASATTAHILGLETRAGLQLQNSVLALAPDGRVAGLRAKRRLFPVLETPFLGLRAARRYLPGSAPPFLDVAGRRVATLVCFESLDRGLALAGKAGGAQLLAISAIDGMLGTPDLEIDDLITEHILSITVLRAVETGLPTVRSALHGPAAFITPDGRVLAHSTPNTDGVLTAITP